MVWPDKVNQVLLTEQVDLLVSSQRLLAGEWHVKPASTGHVHLNKQQTHDKSLHPFQKTKQHISAWSNTNTRQKLTPKMTDPVSLNKQHMTKVCISEAQALLSWTNNTWQRPASQKHWPCYPEQTRRENSQHLTNTGLVILNKQHMKTASISQTQALLSWTNKLWKQPASHKHRPCCPEQTRCENSQHLTNTGLVTLSKQQTHDKNLCLQAQAVFSRANNSPVQHGINVHWRLKPAEVPSVLYDQWFVVFFPWLTLISF